MSKRTVRNLLGEGDMTRARRLPVNALSLVYILIAVIAVIFITALIISQKHLDVAGQAIKQAEKMSRSDVAAPAIRSELDTYALMSEPNAAPDFETDGIASDSKKRMREMLALSMSGAMQVENNPIRISVSGDAHDILSFQLSSMTDASANEMIRIFCKEKDTNFWNALRLLNYRQLVFAGNNYKRVITRKEFLGYGKNYEKYKEGFLRNLDGLKAGAQRELTRQ